MRSVLALALCIAAACGLPRTVRDDDKYKLPEGFLFGAGTSSYQTEGAWDTDGKGINVFDYYYHSRSTPSNETGDVASDTYGRYKEDIGLAADLGLNVLRVSISWARIFPDGDVSKPNAAGVQHYHNVFSEMIDKKIEPMVTIYHFDHPQALEDQFGGWLDAKMQDAFADYAHYLFEQYGGKVKYWLTINEATWYCKALGSMFLAPLTFNTTERQNTCVRNTILAHAKAYKIYKQRFYATDKGLVGFGAGPQFYRAATDSEEDIAAAESSNTIGMGIGLTIDPLVFGDYPEAIRGSLDAFTSEEKQLIKGAIDFVGINAYGGQNASATTDGGDGSGSGSGGSGGNHPGGFGGVESAWVLRALPLWMKNRYETEMKLPIFITENGVNGAGATSALDDWDTRAVYSSAFLREMVAGINENGTRVIGYTAWSFVDTFEFANGFSNWGMIHVDFASGTLNRTLKASATFYKTISKTRYVPLVEEGSEPFPDPDAPGDPTTPGKNSFAALQSSLLTTLAALVALKCFQ